MTSTGRNAVDQPPSASSLKVDGPDRRTSVRVRPYRTVDNQIDGAVVVFVDIDALVRGRLYAEIIIATVRAPLVVMDERFIVITANPAFYQVFDTVEGAATEGRSFFDRQPHV